PALVSRLKIMANLDIAERRLPQDGRIKLRQQSREIDFRVSVLPSIFGESVVLRLLDKQSLKTDLTQLGFEPAALGDFQMAVRAALTGHLVLSTLHTNSAAESISRLTDMGVPPFLLSSSLRLVVAQRLARKVCQKCREPYEADEQLLIPYGHAPLGIGRCTLYKGRGCDACHFTGMKGRIALYEVLAATPEIRGLILASTFVNEIRDVAAKQGM